MTPFTSNYETIKETSSKDKSLDLALTSGDMTTPSQGKIQSTFLQSVLSNKFAVAFVVVILGTGLMTYNANPVPPASQFRLGDYAAIVDGGEGGGITASKNGGDLAGGMGINIPIQYFDFDGTSKNRNKSKDPKKNNLSSNQLRLEDYAAIVDGSEGGGITGSENGGDSVGGSCDQFGRCKK